MADSEDTTTLPDITRSMLEAEIERMISALDLFDPDPDIEPQGDEEPTEDAEPLLGWTGMESSYNRYGPQSEDFELDTAEEEPDFGSLEQMSQLGWAKGRDAEPSLGSLSSSYSQEQWSDGGTKDFEDEHDGSEPCCEDEGAQCEDEGCVDEDMGAGEDDPGMPQWGGPQLYEQEATTRACQGAIARVRHLQERSGQIPIQPLRVLGGVVWK